MTFIEDYQFVTRAPGLIWASQKDVVRAAKAWLEEAQARAEGFHRFAGVHVQPGSTSFKERRCGISLEEAFVCLDPLTAGGPTFHLFLDSDSAWTAYYCNDALGQGYPALVRGVSEELGVRAVHALDTGPQDQSPSRIFHLYDRGNEVRILECFKEDQGWEFIQGGKLQDFEDPKAYRAKRKPDRFTSKMLREYLVRLGARPFEDDWFVVNRSHPALGLERVDRDPETRARFQRMPLIRRGQ